ncbi:phage terminase large subunit [Aquimarina algiphila]|uniref:Terminase n=1 Tax=Aquimarina algiphila TaxID=2047982 RepID=A0A554VE15_9FLAO|nr:phage terminase large subunit [Aquimarina algiphila]TSE05242.1 terminase [Aquimarina algiphila]
MSLTLNLDVHGNQKQLECCRYWSDDTTTDIVYGGSKGSGKSYLGCSLIFSDALTYPGTHYFIARKKLNDLRKFTKPSIKEVFKHWGIDERYYRFDGNDNFFELHNGSIVYLLEAKYLPSDKEYARFGSMQMTRGWIEEAGEFEEDAKNNLAASIGRWKNDEYGLTGKLLQTCNPAKNYLYRDYYKKFKANVLEEWKKFIQALPQDNKRLAKGYLDNLRRILNKNQRERLLNGNWEADDDPTAMCDYDNILSIFENDHVATTGKKYITCDVARFGSDKARIGVWDGWDLIEVHSFDISKTTEIQDCIKAMRVKHGIPKIYSIADQDGVGGGVVDNCKILGFTNNSSPVAVKGQSENYKNLQVQCLYMLAKMINTFEFNISCELSGKDKDDIIEELEQLKTNNKDLNKLDVISKETIKSNIGRSPDWRDMFLMRAYFDLPRNIGRTKRAALL